MCIQTILKQLVLSIHKDTLTEELSGCRYGLDLLVRLILAEYASPPDDNNTQWKEEHLFMLNALFKTASQLDDKGRLLVPALQLVIQHGTLANEAAVSWIHNLYASLSTGEIAVVLETPEAKDMLLNSLTSSSQDARYLFPTACALHVLLASSPDETCTAREEGNKALINALVNVVTNELTTIIHHHSTTALGKLVRLTPFFLKIENVQECELRRKWLRCLLQLTIQASKGDELLKTTLADLLHPHIESSTHANQYMQLTTYLFTPDCGLHLLKDTAATVAALNEFTLEIDSSSPLLLGALSDFDLLCSIIVWPIYNFSLASMEQRIEVTTIVSKLVNLPELLQCLWRIYQYGQSSTFGALTGKKKELLLKEVRAGNVVHLPFVSEAPAELFSMVTGAIGGRSFFWDPYPAVSVLFFTLLSYFVDATDFMEELDSCTVMDRDDAVMLVLALKEIVHRSYMHGILPNCNSEAVAQTALTLLAKLHVIDEVQSFVPHPSVWITTDLTILDTVKSIDGDKWTYVKSELELFTLKDTAGDAAQLVNPNCAALCHPQWAGSTTWSKLHRVIRLLQNAPFTISFFLRATLFSRVVLGRGESSFFGSRQGLFVRRGHIFMDAFDQIANNPATPELVGVRFRDNNNNVEEGHGEGVYREFLVSLCNEAFAAEYGMFCQTETGDVYPNPFSYETTGDSQHLRRITFLGAMVGRSLRDGVLLDIPFAPHFRNAILGRSNSINNLKSFDKQLYRHIISLRSLSDKEIEGLSLTFTYTANVLGEVREVELLRDGRNIPVTRRNCLNYIHLVACFKLNHESARQTKAFLEGLKMIVDLSWLKLFDSNELMKLFGGDAEGAIDVADWRRHTQYHSADDEESAPVHYFWQVVESMSQDERKKLLKFTTSMPRPPLLGFRFLSPPFKVHVVWGTSEEWLPSASTCFSTLKLPPYKDVEAARRKIKAAIEETDEFAFS
ncbi:putative ubiquitin-protein ligase [Trypanosoma rangeli]|uniref:HECT-type E3 ubiquitin transferase n=1 Tax=Trypanosoma rangeli TaxID=5698 RepID=A0A3R7NW67_TRYRA|nr:putative ubiquitin-protein ligase [Trypanosoma rangeli]RNF12748.1 putative ubiquitin-protein ligase [Trypanosoma rangeli]|eukprot:RNF12748.1 putative ubiquitin-protein ligase [Trypanosoma rangeli]